MRAVNILPLFAVVLISTNAQRYAPGVPPPQQQQQFQQPPQQQQQQQYQQPPQQQQQQQQQYQQPPQQQQQQQQYQQQPPQQQQQQQYQPPPQQQQQQQVNQMNQQQQQQPPPAGGHGHGHGHGHGRDNNLRFSSDVHNAEHVMEHLENVIETKPKGEMSEEELEFHYFKMHDYDNNNKLDGVEIGKALTHYHDDESSNSTDSKDSSDHPPPEQKKYEDEMISNIVDSVLKENDINGDGYIEYAEFKRAQEAEKQKQPAPKQDNN